LDLRDITELDAEAIGEPGKRVFRIRARGGEQTASLWLEKQQLQALSLAIRQVLEQASHSAEPGPGASPAIPIADFPLEPSLDFRVGRLALGWDERSQRVILQAYPLEADEDEAAAFSCLVAADHAIAFCDVADAAVAGGRPTCVLCGEPVDAGGHACIRANGHRKDEIPSLGEADDEGEDD
jgi:uncharacterized repeat protein (TIGR03847 family)